MSNYWLGFISGVITVYGLSLLGAGIFYLIDVGRNIDDKTIQEKDTRE